MIVLLFVLVFALIGAPVFAVMAGATQLAWLTHPDTSKQFLRFLAPDVLDERFAGSPILVTVPLFTFIGYLLAESKAPDRIVRASAAFFGWLPGGLAIVCIIASAFFTTLTGGSAVTIVAVGGLLYPALVRYGYPKDYSLGLVMTGGSLGLLLPPSLPILIYSLVAGIDFNKAFKAGVIPGLLVVGLLGIHAMYTGVKYKIPRTKVNLREMGTALWDIKWELGIPVLILGSLGAGLADIDEAAAIAAFYVLAVELLVHKDLKVKDLPRLSASSMALAGALLLIMAMAMALTTYLIYEQVPNKIFEWFTGLGVTQRWHFLVMLNLFMYVQGALMEGFSSILVAVPLLIPFGAEFGLSPFHLAMMFLLNLEIAFLAPPFGQNLFVTSFRFNKPMASLYRISLPFIGILVIGLLMIMYIPGLSTVAVAGDIAKAKAKSAEFGEPPREAWLMECVQEDRNNPLPCSEEDKKKWGSGQDIAPQSADDPTTPDPAASGEPPVADGDDAGADDGEDDDLLEQMMGGDGGATDDETEDKGKDEEKDKPEDSDTDDDLLKEMLEK
jgi:tripartite ATP-independent transporter DctM subunit